MPNNTLALTPAARKLIEGYVESRLNDWSDWLLAGGATDDTLMRLYPPHVSWLSLGIRSPHRSTILLSLDDDDMLAVNDMVNALPEVLRDAVVIQYTRLGTQDGKAAALGITRDTWRGRLKLSYLYLIQSGI